MVSETTLTYQIYVAPIIAMAGKDIPPGQRRSTWSPDIGHPHLRPA